ncbi:hypothetical protein LWI28_004081 [Acer negundo]|uniref:Uncharacterized protein n=1 Tax=Acer negundo TaxID=4023 RepID=A0AAD5NQN7_ACENE|nr:hypothetical protein LWI28_004081 [Acer negundo]
MASTQVVAYCSRISRLISCPVGSRGMGPAAVTRRAGYPANVGAGYPVDIIAGYLSNAVAGYPTKFRHRILSSTPRWDT